MQSCGAGNVIAAVVVGLTLLFTEDTLLRISQLIVSVTMSGTTSLLVEMPHGVMMACDGSYLPAQEGLAVPLGYI